MTDRELLELAAKAAGIVGVDDVYPIFRGASKDWDLKDWSEWNPLTEDGDALWLAVKLKLRVHIREIEVSVDIYEGGAWQNQVVVGVSWNADPYDATRRAIVRAAAEIGRNMK
jgi:hypothetical protein